MIWAQGKQKCIECGKEVWNDYVCARCKRFSRYSEGVEKLDKWLDMRAFKKIKEMKNMPELDIKPFVDATCIKDKQEFVFMDEGELKEHDFGTEEKPDVKQLFHITISTNKIEYTYSMNPKSQVNFIKKYGKDTSKWVGKKGYFRVVTMNVFGNMKEVLFGYPVEVRAK